MWRHPAGRAHQSLDDDVTVAFADALEVFRSLGVELAADRPDFSGLAEPFTTIAEVAFAGLAHELTHEQIERIGQGPRQLIDHGRRIDAGAYYAAQQAAHRESASILRFWEQYDVLITPDATAGRQNCSPSPQPTSGPRRGMTADPIAADSGCRDPGTTDHPPRLRVPLLPRTGALAMLAVGGLCPSLPDR